MDGFVDAELDVAVCTVATGNHTAIELLTDERDPQALEFLETVHASENEAATSG